ncbi:MAG: hypothetical protein HY721_20145 [Planctomycetes bacterium]|nr:hypothetical protein [Planctomycetota bacterium]
MTSVSSRFPRLGVVAGISLARLYLFGVLYLFFLTTELRRNKNLFLFQREGQTRENREAEIQGSFWERLGPFDGQFYLDISRNGYRTISSSIQGDLGNYAFFPLLPGVLAASRAAFPRSYVQLTVAAAFVAGVLGTLALWRLAEKCGTSPLLAVGVLLCFPSAPFQLALYTEGIALCLSGMGLVYAMERKAWRTACLGLLAGLSRPQGALLAIPAFVELVLPSMRGGAEGPRPPRAAWLAVLAPLVGFAVMAVVSYHVSGSPSAFLTVQRKWGRTYDAGGFVKAFLSVFSYEGPPMDLLGLLVGLGCIPILWKRLPLSVFLYGLGAVLMPLATGSILSVARFMSVSLPHMLALAVFLQGRGTSTRAVLLVTFLALQSLLARGLMGWYFVG